jgi:hypothetical protein
MKLTNILEKENNALIFEQHMNNSQTILTESMEGMNALQRAIVEGIYNDLKPLIEASLTADQVQQLFKGVEQNVSATGNNRTLVGAGKDAVGKANDTINKVGRWLQDTTPVKAADQKFEQLKTTIGTKFPELDKQLTGLGLWMKENPGKSAAIIGVLTTIAALAGGPVGGALAGQILRGSSELIKGEKLSTAVGKGLKTAAIGALAGFTMDAIGDMISDTYAQFNPIPLNADTNFRAVNIGNGLPSTYQNATLYGTEEQLDQFRTIWQEARNKWSGGDFAGAEQAFQQAKDFAARVSDETMNTIAIEGDPAEKIKALKQAMDGLSAAAQGAAAGATAFDKQGKPVTDNAATPEVKQENTIYKSEKLLSEGQVYLLFDRVCSTNNRMLSEGVIWEADDPAAPKMSTWDKIKTKASEFGKNLTTKVTASKLNSAWKSAGQPTDSEEIAAFLVKQGVNAEVVDKTYSDMKLPKPKAAQAAEEQPATDAGQDAATGTETSSTAPAATPTVEKPAVSTSANNSSANATQQSNAAGTGPTKNTNTLYSQVRADIKRLDKRSKQQLMSYLEKGLSA